MRDIQRKDKILLLGFNSELTEIKLSDHIIIRKGADYELEEIYGRIKYDNLKTQQFIIEYEYTESNESTFPRKLFKLLDDLNLFFAIFLGGETKVAFVILCLKENTVKLDLQQILRYRLIFQMNIFSKQKTLKRLEIIGKDIYFNLKTNRFK